MNKMMNQHISQHQKTSVGKACVFAIAASCVFLAACGEASGQGQQGQQEQATAEQQEAQIEMEPELSQMRSICELAAVDCYYHNVAKYMEEDAEGILFWKKDRKFWVEYSGVVRLGIDASRLGMQVDGDVVTISIPPAKVLGCKVDETSLNEDSFIVAKDSAKVEAEHQTEAFKETQGKMEQLANEDTAMLNNAEQRVQELLTGYVKNIGSLVGKEYQIKWVYLGDEQETQN